MKKGRDPFAKGKPGRKCMECGRGGGVTWYHGLPFHPKCFRLVVKEGRVDTSRYRTHQPKPEN